MNDYRADSVLRIAPLALFLGAFAHSLMRFGLVYSNIPYSLVHVWHSNKFLFVSLLFLFSFLSLFLTHFASNTLIKKRYGLSRFFVLWIVFLCGFTASLISFDRYESKKLNQALIAHIKGRVMSLPKTLTSESQKVIGKRFLFKVESSDMPDLTVNTKTLITDYDLDTQLPMLGEYWHLKVKLKPPHGYRNGFGFNYEDWLYSQGVHAVGYIKQKQKLSNSKQWLDEYRTLLYKKLHAYPVVSALILGDKSAISKQDYDLFVKTGTAHLFAVSGLHVALAAGFFYAITYVTLFMVVWFANGLKLLAGYQPNLHTVGMCSGWIGALLYSLIAGFALPTQRALLMLGCVLIFYLLRRKSFSLSAFMFALAIIILFDSPALYGASFWLSFAAVGLIFYLSYVCPFDKRGLKFLWVYCLLPIGLMPLNLYFFGQSATIGSLSNLWLVPVFSFVLLPACMLVALIKLIGLSFKINLLHAFIDVIYKLVVDCLEWFSQAGILLYHISFLNGLVLFGLFLMLLYKTSSKQNYVLVKGCVLVLGLCWVLYQPSRPKEGEFVMDVMDVGQGLSIVLQTQHHSLVYDTGNAYRTGFVVADATLVPFLSSQKIHQLDVLMVSHNDRDHSGGFKKMLNAFDVKQIMLGQPIDGASQALCEKGQIWVWDGVQFEVLWPKRPLNEPFDENDNNASCVLRFSSLKHPSHSVLIAGDIERVVEQELVRLDEQSIPDPTSSVNEPKLNSAVLVVPHHGSRTSSSQAFIHAVRPDFAFISSGADNRFRHPHKKVLNRYNRSGVRVYNTSKCGRIRYAPSGRIVVQPTVVHCLHGA